MTENTEKPPDSYVVIARRFRPRSFDEIVGQDPIVRTLRNAIRTERIPHAWLFAGIRGVGKTTTARVLAKALNCENGPTETPCDECPSCTDITTGRSLDVLEIDGASNRGIDQIRELRETVRNYPARDKHRILIIDEVHMLTREAFNALLKTLEEPPAHVRFILATTEMRKVPDTIASRCQVFEFRAMPPEVLERELGRIAEKEKITISPRGLSLIARAAAGSLRDAQSHLDQSIAFCGREIDDERLEDLLAVTNIDTLRGFAAGIAEKDPKILLQLIDSLMQKGADPIQFCRDMQAYVRDLLLVRNGVPAGGGSLLLETDPAATEALAKRFSEDQLIRVFQLLVRDETSIRYSPYPRYLLEVLAIKLARLADLTPIEQLLAEVRGGTGNAGDDGSDESTIGGKTGQQSLPLKGSPAATNRAEPAHPAAPVAASPVPVDRGPAADPTPSPVPPPVKTSRPSILPVEDTDYLPRTEVPEEAMAGADAAAAAKSPTDRIVLGLEAKKASLSAFIGQAARFEIDGDRVIIGFYDRQSFWRQTIEKRDNLALIQQVCGEVLERPVRVEVVEEAEPTRDLGNLDEGKARTNHLLDEAMHEPVVRRLLDTFQGEIVEIHEAEDNKN
jgi:DNA polymerase-3 subunit gamma/tau